MTSNSMLFQTLSQADSWGLVSSILLGLSVALFTRAVVRIAPLTVPLGGTRGSNRQKALSSPLFRSFDPALRRLGALVRSGMTRARSLGPSAKRRIDRLEEFQRRQLIWAGEPLGLDRYEALTASLILAVCGAAVGLEIGASSGTWAWVLPCAIFGGALVNIRLQSLSSVRFTEMSRELPASIDLIALAMNAGSDFPGAIRRVIDGQTGVVAEELSHVLRSLDLGITRHAALLGLRDRVPVQEVRDLVRAVLLAEKKGASITDALAAQARASRQRRSVRAEEAAARAGLLLLMPLMLLMACVMILLVGPLLSSGISL